MSMTRGSFIKGLLGGLAAAPVMSKSATYSPLVEGSAKWEEKRWEANDLKFREYLLPETVGPYFEEARSDRPQFRVIWIPMFDKRLEDRTLEQYVEEVIEASARTEERVRRSGMPVVDEDGKPIEYGGYEKKYGCITIVKVRGYDNLIGIAATEHELVPVRNFYRDVAARGDRIKNGMSKMRADYSQDVKLTEREKASLGFESSLSYRKGRNLPTL